MNNVAWELADKVRIDLDKKSCPGVYMNIAMESITRNYERESIEIQNDVPKINFMILHEFAEVNRIDYNKLCTAVRESIDSTANGIKSQHLMPQREKNK